MAIAYALVLFNIHNVVGDLESSFDHIGVDDIHFCIREHLSRLHHGLPGNNTTHTFYLLLYACMVLDQIRLYIAIYYLIAMLLVLPAVSCCKHFV